jgi:hypothetical protein
MPPVNIIASLITMACKHLQDTIGCKLLCNTHLDIFVICHIHVLDKSYAFVPADAFDMECIANRLKMLEKGKAVDIAICDFVPHQRSTEVRKVRISQWVTPIRAHICKGEQAHAYHLERNIYNWKAKRLPLFRPIIVPAGLRRPA